MCACLVRHVTVSVLGGARSFLPICAGYLSRDDGYLDRRVMPRKCARMLAHGEQGVLGEHRQFLKLEN